MVKRPTVLFVYYTFTKQTGMVVDAMAEELTARGCEWQDALLGLAHPRSFERIAVVTDSASIRRLVKLAGWSVPGELKLLANREREQAEAWAKDLRGLTTKQPPPRELAHTPMLTGKVASQITVPRKMA